MLPISSLIFPVIYVLPFYVFQAGHPRNHPKTIWTRIYSTTLVTCLCAWIPSYIAAASTWHETPTLADVAIWFGLRHQGFLTACTLPLLLTATLFAGPLFMVLTDKQPRQHLPPWPLPVRNLIAAPLSEELCFRCGLISYLLLCGSPEMQCLFLSPLIFGAAHLHHYLDLTRHQGVSSQQAALIVTAQLFYSTLFGWYAAFLLMRTGSLIPLVVTHSFCNYMGFPSFGDIPRHPQAVLVAGVLVAGVFGFIKLLFPLTDPGLYGYPPGQSYVSSVMHT